MENVPVAMSLHQVIIEMIHTCQPRSDKIREILSFIYRVEIKEKHDEILAALEVAFQGITDDGLLRDYQQVRESIHQQKVTAEEKRNKILNEFMFLSGQIAAVVNDFNIPKSCPGDDIYRLEESVKNIKELLGISD